MTYTVGEVANGYVLGDDNEWHPIPKPGDVVNGYILGEDNQWHIQAPKPSVMSRAASASLARAKESKSKHEQHKAEKAEKEAQEKAANEREQSQRKADKKAQEVQEAAEKETFFAEAFVAGKKPSNKVQRTVREYARPGERPWLIIGDGFEGYLVAFEDRVLIVKVGALTSFAAGSMGGGRVSTFHFADITGIEYNSGLINGVLEILTASYTGTKNHDFWSMGANDNPFQLSNTIPLCKSTHKIALPSLNRLRDKIAQAKRLQVVVPKAPAPTPGVAGGLTNELAKLAELMASGVLDDAEFTAAKKALIETSASKSA